MFRSKMMLPILAVIVGVAASAFTVSNSAPQNEHLESYVWFPINSVGTAFSGPATITTMPSEDAPSTGDDVFCSAGLSLSDGQVVDNHDGTYTRQITDPAQAEGGLAKKAE